MEWINGSIGRQWVTSGKGSLDMDEWAEEYDWLYFDWGYFRGKWHIRNAGGRYGGVDIPTDHKLTWININGNGARSDDNVCSEFQGNWNKINGLSFRGVLLASWNEKGVVEGLEGCERVERVWEEYVQGLHSTRRLFRRGVASKRKSKGDKEFKGIVNIKRQELKRVKKEWESAVGIKQVHEDKDVLDRYNK